MKKPHPNMGRVHSYQPSIAKPTTRELEWAAGFFEGEGSLSIGSDRSFQITAVQNDMEPLERLHKIFGGRRPYLYRPAKGNRKDCFRWYASGARARGIAMTLFCLLSQRRQKQIAKALVS